MRQAITTKFLGPTNSRGARLTAQCRGLPADVTLGDDGKVYLA